MAGYDHHAGRSLPGRLTLFPEPYPGESFYSVLCRYHVRSGNINGWRTISQLFGYNSSMGSTLLTPFHLEMVKYWVPDSPDIRAEDMLRGNTAYTVYALSAFSYEIAQMQEVITSRDTTRSFPHNMQSRLASHAGRLRFCPECAAEQRKIYGEPYWQVLFQLDEVEYCPLHRIRVRTTPIPYKSIRSHFYPASLVLDPQSTMPHEMGTAWDDLFNTEKGFFIKLSQNIAWLLQNGTRYEGYHKLQGSYTRIMGTAGQVSNWYTISKMELQKILAPLSHNAMIYKYVETKNASQFRYDLIYVYSLKICSHILLMTALCGHPKVFYEGA